MHRRQVVGLPSVEMNMSLIPLTQSLADSVFEDTCHHMKDASNSQLPQLKACQLQHTGLLCQVSLCHVSPDCVTCHNVSSVHKFSLPENYSICSSLLCNSSLSQTSCIASMYNTMTCYNILTRLQFHVTCYFQKPTISRFLSTLQIRY